MKRNAAMYSFFLLVVGLLMAGSSTTASPSLFSVARYKAPQARFTSPEEHPALLTLVFDEKREEEREYGLRMQVPHRLFSHTLPYALMCPVAPDSTPSSLFGYNALSCCESGRSVPVHLSNRQLLI